MIIPDAPEQRPVPPLGVNQPEARWTFDGGVLMALLLISLVAGCLVNALRARPVPWTYASHAETMDAAVTSLSAGTAGQEGAPPAQEIRLEDFQAFVTQHKGLVLDARPKVFYDLAHVPGAVSLPREAFAESYPRSREKFEGYKDRPEAVYCSGADCTDSQLVTDALTKLGYRHLLIYTSGWEEWSQTGLPQEGSAAQP